MAAAGRRPVSGVRRSAAAKRAHVADYGIQHHATLECCPRKRGGCFIVSITLWIIIFVCFLLSLCTCGLSLPIALLLIPFALLLPLCCL